MNQGNMNVHWENTSHVIDVELPQQVAPPQPPQQRAQGLENNMNYWAYNQPGFPMYNQQFVGEFATYSPPPQQNIYLDGSSNSSSTSSISSESSYRHYESSSVPSTHPGSPISSNCPRYVCNKDKTFNYKASSYKVNKDNSLKTKRSRMGCLTCRNRKKRCCETRPKCTECARLGLSCTWPAPGTEHRNKPRDARVLDGMHYDAFYGHIKILRGIVEHKIDV